MRAAVFASCLFVTAQLYSAPVPCHLPEQSLAERLGFSPTDRIVIINADDIGMCHSCNVAAEESMTTGLVTSASLMVACPWFSEIALFARANAGADFGVHLTLTSEWSGYRWGPTGCTATTSELIDSQGYFWPSVAELYAHATPAEAEEEARAQIERARTADIDITHIDSHMGSLQFDDDYFQVYRRLAHELDVPVRMASEGGPIPAELLAQELYELENDRILHPDRLILDQPVPGQSPHDFWVETLNNLGAGVTEIYIHPAMPGDEINAITPAAPVRTAEFQLFAQSDEIREILANHDVKRIGYRALRELQRMERATCSEKGTAPVGRPERQPSRP